MREVGNNDEKVFTCGAVSDSSGQVGEVRSGNGALIQCQFVYS